MEHQVDVVEVKDRRPLLAERCAGRSVLHVGCCDVPVFDPDKNLHLFLARHADRLDGLDVSAEGIDVLRRFVPGEYYTHAGEISREYDLVLVPEVLEHTRDPGAFLEEIFSVRARQYLLTAPSFQWSSRGGRVDGVFHEQVHPDHKAWYSPYTLLNTLRPFIDEPNDHVEVFLFESTGSVGAAITRPFVPRPFPAPASSLVDGEAAISVAAERCASDDLGGAIAVLAAARGRSDGARLLSAHVGVLLGSGQPTEALRQAVGWLRLHPGDPGGLELCADAAEALGDRARADAWRKAARAGR